MSTQEQQRDRALYYNSKPVSGNLAARNNDVIENTIRKYEAKRLQEQKKFHDKLGERTDAATYYLMHIANGKSGTPEQYFGKRELARLQARNIVSKLMSTGRYALSALEE